jgi:hypothetical protein
MAIPANLKSVSVRGRNFDVLSIDNATAASVTETFSKKLSADPELVGCRVTSVVEQHTSNAPTFFLGMCVSSAGHGETNFCYNMSSEDSNISWSAKEPVTVVDLIEDQADCILQTCKAGACD